MTQRDPPDDGTRVRPKPPSPPTSAGTGTGVTTAGGTGRSARAGPPSRIGRFEVSGVLGEGAFGSVYLAFDPELQRQVAVKVPHPDGLTPAFRERFLREARATATIHHPNVCPVYEVGAESDVPFIVMHYVVGGTLAALLSQVAPLPPRHALVIARKLALGVAAAHAKGVIHRDLKPQNVLYDRAAREVLVTDFGLARLSTASRETADGTVLGTPAYMSPEQARGKRDEVGPPSDVYSLGVILYHMLTGELPFTGSIFEVLAQHCEAVPRAPSSVNSALDPRLDELCLRAMAKDPADRFPSAREFADFLAEYLRDKPETTREGFVAETADPVQVAPPVPLSEKGEWPAARELVLARSARNPLRTPRPPYRATVRAILGCLLLTAIAAVVVVLSRGTGSPATEPGSGTNALSGDNDAEAPASRPGDKLKAQLIGRWRFLGLPFWLNPAEVKKMGLSGRSFYMEFEPDGTAHFGADSVKGTVKGTREVSFKYEVLSDATVKFDVPAKGNFKADRDATLEGVRTVTITEKEMILTAKRGVSSRLVQVK